MTVLPLLPQFRTEAAGSCFKAIMLPYNDYGVHTSEYYCRCDGAC